MLRTAYLLVVSALAVWAQSAETIPFRAVLSSQNEVPAVNINASGMGTVWLHVVRDAQGKVISASTDFDASYRFPAAVQFTGMHIHKGRAGENGPVTIDSGIRGATPVASGENGTGRLQFQGFTASDNAAGLDTVNGLLTDPSGFYFNIHTTVNPGGVIRGQLQRADMIILMAQLSPLNEVPAITDVTAAGIGSIIALRTFDSNGNLTSGLVTFDANYTGFPEGTTFTGFHIHESPRGVNGAVTINTGINAAANAVTANPAGGNLHYDVEVPLENAAAVRTLNNLFSMPDQYYMNLHTTVYPNGVIRSQLRTTDTIRFPVVLSNTNEVPATSVASSAPSVFEAHTIRNASGAVEAAVGIFDVNYRTAASTTFTGLHIHNGKAGENGPVTIDSGLSARNPIVSESGNGNVYRVITYNSAMALAAFNSAVATPENHYLNIHTTQFGGGLMRSQLMPASTATPTVSAVISAVSDPSLRRLAPGGLFTIFGTNLGRVMGDPGASSNGQALPTAYNGTSVRIGDADAPIVAVGNGYIVAQVPFEVTPGMRRLIVRNANGASEGFDVQVAMTAPALFFDGQGGIFTTLGFQLVGRAGAPAPKGQYIIAYATGLASAGTLGTGKIVTQTMRSTEVTATIDGKPATVLGAWASPGFVGLYQVYILVPTDARSGTIPLVIRSGEGVSNSVNLLVQ